MTGRTTSRNMRSNSSGSSDAPTSRAVSMNRSRWGFSSGGDGLRAGMSSSARSSYGFSMFWHPSPTDVDISPAPVANQNQGSARKARLWLENRFSAILIAVCTKIMTLCGRLCLFFQNISKRSSVRFGELIFLLLSIPFFKVSHLFFKGAYLLKQRKLVRLGRDCAILGGHDYSLQFDDLLPHDGSVVKTYHRLREFGRGLEASKYAGKSCHGHIRVPVTCPSTAVPPAEHR